LRAWERGNSPLNLCRNYRSHVFQRDRASIHSVFTRSTVRTALAISTRSTVYTVTAVLPIHSVFTRSTVRTALACLATLARNSAFTMLAGRPWFSLRPNIPILHSGQTLGNSIPQITLDLDNARPQFGNRFARLRLNHLAFAPPLATLIGDNLAERSAQAVRQRRGQIHLRLQ
jgi:hypothetical protein